MNSTNNFSSDGGLGKRRMSNGNMKEKGTKLRNGNEVSDFLPKQLFVLARHCDLIVTTIHLVNLLF